MLVGNVVPAGGFVPAALRGGVVSVAPAAGVAGFDASEVVDEVPVDPPSPAGSSASSRPSPMSRWFRSWSWPIRYSTPSRRSKLLWTSRSWWCAVRRDGADLSRNRGGNRLRQVLGADRHPALTLEHLRLDREVYGNRAAALNPADRTRSS